ncbi:MAG: C25 family cysteine peptidase [Methanosarcinales archaeon]|nr:C25 family cysteine peptidase [ANME-2 cluster archaeon]MDW7775527.1 C25 family cysteine peptidase [Methanosarcinales archaeon]
MKRNKLIMLASICFIVMLTFSATGIAAAAIADSDEQMDQETDANIWNNYMSQKGYATVYNHQDSKSNVLGRIPSDTIWMFSGHGGDLSGVGATRLYFGDPANSLSYIAGGDVPSNTIKLAYADACKSSVRHWGMYDVSEGFINQGTTAYIGFTRTVSTGESEDFTDEFGYLLIQGNTVHNSALWAGQRTNIGSDYTIYGDDSITI